MGMHTEKIKLFRGSAVFCLEGARNVKEAGKHGWWPLGQWSEEPYCREPPRHCADGCLSKQGWRAGARWWARRTAVDKVILAALSRGGEEAGKAVLERWLRGDLIQLVGRWQRL